MSKLNLINVESALNSLTAKDATKADLQSLQIPSLRNRVDSIATGVDNINSALGTITDDIKKKV